MSNIMSVPFQFVLWASWESPVESNNETNTVMWLDLTTIEKFFSNLKAIVTTIDNPLYILKLEFFAAFGT